MAMIDHTQPRQGAHPPADRKAEAVSRRLAVTAGPPSRRAFWLTTGVTTVVSSGRSVLAGVRQVSVKSGTAFSPTTDRP
jgi:hypothetical protein